MVRVHYVGRADRRIIEDLVWDSSNDFTVEVSNAMGEKLSNDPDFVIVGDQSRDDDNQDEDDSTEATDDDTENDSND